jgi:hypothetical protein
MHLLGAEMQEPALPRPRRAQRASLRSIDIAEAGVDQSDIQKTNDDSHNIQVPSDVVACRLTKHGPLQVKKARRK